MGSKEKDVHISLDTMWKYRAENIPLSQDERIISYAASGCGSPMMVVTIVSRGLASVATKHPVHDAPWIEGQASGD
jgi:hypothetical protein